MSFVLTSKLIILLLCLYFSAQLKVNANAVRTKRTLTTICVEIRPSAAQEQPYYMCKDADWPRFREHGSSKFSSSYAQNNDNAANVEQQNQKRPSTSSYGEAVSPENAFNAGSNFHMPTTAQQYANKQNNAFSASYPQNAEYAENIDQQNQKRPSTASYGSSFHMPPTAQQYEHAQTNSFGTNNNKNGGSLSFPAAHPNSSPSTAQQAQTPQHTHEVQKPKSQEQTNSYNQFQQQQQHQQPFNAGFDSAFDDQRQSNASFSSEPVLSFAPNSNRQSAEPPNSATNKGTTNSQAFSQAPQSSYGPAIFRAQPIPSHATAPDQRSSNFAGFPPKNSAFQAENQPQSTGRFAEIPATTGSPFLASRIAQPLSFALNPNNVMANKANDYRTNNEMPLSQANAAKATFSELERKHSNQAAPVVPTLQNRHRAMFDEDVFHVPNWGFKPEELDIYRTMPDAGEVGNLSPLSQKQLAVPQPHQQLSNLPLPQLNEDSLGNQHSVTIPLEHLDDPVMRQWYASLQEPLLEITPNQNFAVEPMLGARFSDDSPNWAPKAENETPQPTTECSPLLGTPSAARDYKEINDAPPTPVTTPFSCCQPCLQRSLTLQPLIIALPCGNSHFSSSPMFSNYGSNENYGSMTPTKASIQTNGSPSSEYAPIVGMGMGIPPPVGLFHPMGGLFRPPPLLGLSPFGFPRLGLLGASHAQQTVGDGNSNFEPEPTERTPWRAWSLFGNNHNAPSMEGQRNSDESLSTTMRAPTAMSSKSTTIPASTGAVQSSSASDRNTLAPSVQVTTTSRSTATDVVSSAMVNSEDTTMCTSEATTSIESSTNNNFTSEANNTYNKMMQAARTFKDLSKNASSNETKPETLLAAKRAAQNMRTNPAIRRHHSKTTASSIENMKRYN